MSNALNQFVDGQVDQALKPRRVVGGRRQQQWVPRRVPGGINPRFSGGEVVL